MAASAPSRNLAVPLTAFAAGAVVALLVGVFGKVHDPTLAGTTTLGFHTVIDMKAHGVDFVATMVVVSPDLPADRTHASHFEA